MSAPTVAPGSPPIRTNAEIDSPGQRRRDALCGPSGSSPKTKAKSKPKRKTGKIADDWGLEWERLERCVFAGKAAKPTSGLIKDKLAENKGNEFVSKAKAANERLSPHRRWSIPTSW